MWVARISDNLGKFHIYDLSPKFKDVYECQKYIDENLQDIEEYLSKVFDRICKIKGYISLGGRFVRCYNLSQKRFATGFDF